MRKTVTLVALLALFSCRTTNASDFEKGKNILQAQGYTEITYTGHKMACCNDQDAFATGFVGKDPRGNKVAGCFCSGLDKGLKIRFE